MRTALISDIHGNLEALTAVLEDIDNQDVDKIHSLGDVVGYGADPKACLDLVIDRCDARLMGNHEYTVLGLQSMDYYNEAAKTAITWTRSRLLEEDLSAIADFKIDFAADDYYLVHSSPYQPERWHYIFTEEEARLAFQHLKGSICFYGHSHVPTVISGGDGTKIRLRAGHTFEPDLEECRYLVNVGSVGQPRDRDPRACYAIFDDEQSLVTLRRVEYDIAAAQEKMSAATLPEILVSRLAAGV